MTSDVVSASPDWDTAETMGVNLLGHPLQLEFN